MRADTNGTLSERPDVRVRAVPAIMRPARESTAGGRETQGRLSWGHPFFAAKERVQKKLRCARRTLLSALRLLLCT